MIMRILGKKNMFFIIFLLPSLLGVLIFVFIPFIDSIRRSFCSMGSGKLVGLKNYKMVFENEAFILALKNTVKFTFICIPLLIIISFCVAYGISRLKYIRLIKSILLFPLAVPTAVLVLVWKLLFENS